MRVTHPTPVTVECDTYACTLDRDNHEPVDNPNFDHAPDDVWHHDETTGVWWPDRLVTYHPNGSENGQAS